MENTFQDILATISLYLPTILLAIAILIVGWIVALIAAAITRGILRRITLDDRIAAMIQDDQPQERRISTERWISGAVFWLILFITLVIFLQTLNLTVVSQPLSQLLSQILAFIPGLLAALVLLFVAWLVATFLRILVVRLLSATGFARRLTTDAQVRTQDRVSIAQTIGNIVYWLVFLLFLPAILDALNLQGILVPVQRVVDEILGVLPNLLGAVVILVVGWLVARIVRQIVTNILAGLGIDRLGAQAGATNVLGEQRLSNIIGTIVYILILIPVAIAALNTLNIPAVSVPASNMLNALLNALPAIFGAFLLLAIAYFVARIVGGFVAGLLRNIGFDRFFARIGLFRRVTGVEPPPYNPGPPPSGPMPPSERQPVGAQPGRLTPSTIVGYLVTVAIILFAVMEAANLLGFEILAVLVSRFIVAATQVLIGLIIFGIGLYLSSLAERVIRDSGASQAHILAPAARAAIIIFSAALALREMGIAESIVNLAFGLLLGAVAVAVGLAFGLGGREAAARQLERWQREINTSPPPAGTTGPEMRPGEAAGPDKG